MHRSLLALLLLSCVISTARMQDKPRWPPHAQDIFDPSIEVLDFNMLDKVQQSPLGEISIIPESRVIKGADGRVYPWPESVGYFQYMNPSPLVIDDDLYLYEMHSPQSDIYGTWTLNLGTGIFAKYESYSDPNTPCGKLWPKRTGWDLYTVNGQPILCNIATGQQILIPDGYTIAFTTQDKPFITELADNRQFFIGKSTEMNTFALFIYDPATKQSEIIATMPLKASISYEVVNPDIILMQVFGGVPHTSQYVVFHPSNNSLTLYQPSLNTSVYVSQWSFWPNPNRIIVNKSANNTCTTVLYDLVTNKEQTFDYGNLCNPDYTDVDGTGYYREISADQKIATVIRFNPLEGKREELYKGEVEGIQWVSHDTRYLMLVIDNSGQVDLLPSNNFGPNSPQPNGTLKLIDSQYRLTGFKTQAYTDGMSSRWRPFVSEIAPNWLAISHGGYGMEIKDQLIHLSPDAIQIHDISIQYGIDEQWASYSDDSTIGLYHLENNQKVAIFKYPVIDNYILNNFLPLGNDRFEVTISYSYWPAEDPPNPQMASFVIHIPNINLPIGQHIPMYLYVEDGAY
jgi:hypothetical protein